jgi:hypothetical protein
MQLLEANDAARLVGLSRDGVVSAAERGALPVFARTPRGLRLFRVEDVERFAQARAERQAGRGREGR